VNEGVLSLWSKVLKSVPTSRLLLRCPQGSRRSWVLNRLDVDPQRIEFIGLQPREMYLRTYNMIDIALDTFPYNGHTTSLDGLWMGVPMVTLVGRTVVGRAGLSQCINLGVSEFVARDESAFISISREWAGDLRRLSNLRSALRGLMEKSPLMDAARFAQNVELAYRQIWQEWSRA
jgi:predicted O-linked N-acetylglucosamine transferase (SPINDLY family)